MSAKHLDAAEAGNSDVLSAKGDATPPPDCFVVWQSLVPNRLGIAIEEVRRLRRELLVEGVDWVTRGNRCLWTAEGEGKVRAHLVGAVPGAGGGGAAPQEKAEPGAVAKAPGAVKAEAGPAGAGATRRVLVVWRSAPAIRNRHIVEAKFEGETEVQLIWVRDNGAFRKGMKILEEWVRKRKVARQWDYVARRMPR